MINILEQTLSFLHKCYSVVLICTQNIHRSNAYCRTCREIMKASSEKVSNNCPKICEVYFCH